MPSLKDLLSSLPVLEQGKKPAEGPVVHAPAINKGAINAKAAPINEVVREESVAAPVRDSGIGPERVGNGRTRAAYNEYMREYMKKRRAKTASGVTA